MDLKSQARATILVWDEEPRAARATRARLERGGHAVIVAPARDGTFPAVEDVSAVDLAVLGVRPRSEGHWHAFLRWAKAAGLDAPIVMVADMRDKEMLDEALRAGVSEFVPRAPGFRDYLEWVVGRELGRAVSTRPPVSSTKADRDQPSLEQALRREVEERRRAESAIQEAERCRDRFLALLAHELRNPLAPISNAVQIMKVEGTGGPNFDWSIKVIEDQVRQMVRLIDDLLDVSRITRGKVELQKRQVDLEELISLTVEAVRPGIEDGGRRLTLILPSHRVLLEIDVARMAQALASLLNNAARYTDEGGEISLTVEELGEEIVFRVRDDGIGIAPDFLPRVFDMFAQADQDLSHSRGGLGIGLALARSLVELHGGRVAARSGGLGKGSEFTVSVPPGMRKDGGPRRSASEERGETLRLPTRRILVVDDNQRNARSLSLLLRALGQKVATAADGPSALESARRHRPDLVLLDLGLPGMDGYEVARRCRADEALRSTMLVAMTGYGQDEDRRRSREAGFDAHLVKPVDLEDLRSVLGQDDFFTARN